MTVPTTLKDAFILAFHDAQCWINTRWLDVPVVKPPTDLWTYQEILVQHRPDALIETGTASGGSAYFFACIMELLGTGHVWTIDTVPMQDRPYHKRITYVRGDSADPLLVEAVMREVREQTQATRIMISLDSDHHPDHVARELELWAPYVTPDSFCVVEDTLFGGHPVQSAPELGDGPWQAVDAFLQTPVGQRFIRNPHGERFGLTFSPGGWLQRAALTNGG